MTELTQAQLQYEKMIDVAHDLVDKAEEGLTLLLKNCPHFFTPLTEQQAETLRTAPWKAGRCRYGRCQICGENFGWRCPDSPDGICHYGTNHKSKVELVIGSPVDPPDDWKGPECESMDWCLYCGHPDERK